MLRCIYIYSFFFLVFQEARGHDIIRDYLVNDLKKNMYIDDKELSTNLTGSFGSKKRKYSAKAKKNLRPDPFYRNVQNNTQNPRTQPAESSSFSNTRMDHRSPQRSHPSNRQSNAFTATHMGNRSRQRNHPYNRQNNGFSETNNFCPDFTQNLNPYSPNIQLKFYEDNNQPTSNRYNNRRGRY